MAPPRRGDLLADLKQIAREIFSETLAGIDIPATMSQKLARAGSRIAFDDDVIDLAAYGGIAAIAIGKAAVAMARGFAELFADDFAFEGILVAPHESVAEVRGFRSIGAAHPVPDQGSVLAARAIIDLLSRCDAGTLVFFLLSGGGSPLVELPLDPGVTLEDMRELHRLLVTCGAPINEINAVRKHVSAVKGGRLAALAAASTKLSLGITDVPLGCESALASGPTLPDPTTVADACRVVESYGLGGEAAFVTAGQVRGPGIDSRNAEAGRSRVRASALLASAHDARFISPRPSGGGSARVCGVLRQFHRRLAARTRRRISARSTRAALAGKSRTPRGARRRWRGEFAGARRWARRTEFGIRAGVRGENRGKKDCRLQRGHGWERRIESRPRAPRPTAQRCERALAAGLNPQEFAARSDSYSFFRELGDAVETGPTGNNLRDLRILLAEAE